MCRPPTSTLSRLLGAQLTLRGVGACFRVINISPLNYLHIYYKAKETQLTRIQCCGELLTQGRLG